jgi:hypothetical protein
MSEDSGPLGRCFPVEKDGGDNPKDGLPEDVGRVQAGRKQEEPAGSEGQGGRRTEQDARRR